MCIVKGVSILVTHSQNLDLVSWYVKPLGRIEIYYMRVVLNSSSVPPTNSVQILSYEENRFVYSNVLTNIPFFFWVRDKYPI